MGGVGRMFFLAAVAVFMLASIGSAARIVGSDGNDTLRGTPQADKLYGKKGNDTRAGRQRRARSRTFVITGNLDETTPDNVRFQWGVRVTGTFSGQSAGGTLIVNMRITVPGFPVDVVCNAPNVTWSASLVP